MEEGRAQEAAGWELEGVCKDRACLNRQAHLRDSLALSEVRCLVEADMSTPVEVLRRERNDLGAEVCLQVVGLKVFSCCRKRRRMEIVTLLHPFCQHMVLCAWLSLNSLFAPAQGRAQM